jgi:hypothetical protein
MCRGRREFTLANVERNVRGDFWPRFAAPSHRVAAKLGAWRGVNEIGPRTYGTGWQHNSTREEYDVKTALLILGLLFVATPASAHGVGDGFGLFGGFGGFEFGHRGGFDGFGGGFGLGVLDADRTQERFENRFDGLKTQYEDGVADVEDFFTSDEYDNILGKTESLTDRYGLFVSGVERSIDRLYDVISIANDDLTYYNDLLADYQADDTLSEQRLARIERWIGRVTDALDLKIDWLTEKQTDLQTGLPTYQAFQTDLSAFLIDITAAGSSTEDAAASLKALANLASVTSESDEVMCAAGSGSLSPATSVPEPSMVALALLGAGGWMSRRRR